MGSRSTAYVYRLSGWARTSATVFERPRFSKRIPGPLIGNVGSVTLFPQRPADSLAWRRPILIPRKRRFFMPASWRSIGGVRKRSGDDLPPTKTTRHQTKTTRRQMKTTRPPNKEIDPAPLSSLPLPSPSSSLPTAVVVAPPRRHRRCLPPSNPAVTGRCRRPRRVCSIHCSLSTSPRTTNHDPRTHLLNVLAAREHKSH